MNIYFNSVMPSSNRHRNLKMVNIGFDGAGKTSMYHTFAFKEFPTDYLPTCFQGYCHSFEINGETISLAFWDTHCGENNEYLELLQLSYFDTDVFTICFDVSNLDVFPDMKKFWVDGQLRPLYRKVPIILVATKIDLRGGDCETISRERGERLAEEIGAAGYFEISSLKKEGLDDLFYHICISGVKYQKKRLKRKCLIL